MLTLPPRPMEPIPWPEPFDHEGWRFQVKWDGVRCLAALRGGRVHLWNRHGAERTDRYPEVAEGLPVALGGADAVLDGEVVALVDGRPSFDAVMRRAAAPAAAGLLQRIPVHYAVFDILSWRGEELVDRPLDERLRVLSAAVRPAGCVHVTETRAAGGVALFAAVRERGLEGIVAKAADSPYRPGPSPLWRKVKVRRRLRCAVVGYTLRDGLLRSLLLGAHAGGRLAYVGAVSAGLSDALRRALHGTLATLPPLQPLTREPAPPGAERRWVRPALAVEVEFAEFTADGRLRHPVLLGLVPDPPEACRLPPEALPAAAARRRE